MDSGCVFCKIAKGEAWAAKVYEDGDYVAFMDIRPMSVGHTLVAPKKHYAYIFEMPDEEVGRLYAVAAKVAKAVKLSINPAGLNLLQNNGSAAGQVIFHVHVHIIPRHVGDAGKFKSGHGRINASREELEET
ncbi:MAG TPA: HIT family protein, partial [Aigarchaeota archaeon]|nr:HIT family protein [Aigarchaeota archaeon]